MADFNQPCADTVTIVDSYSRIVAYEKAIAEVGVVPANTQYPSSTLMPGGALAFYDTFSSLPSKQLSEAFTSGDVIGPHAIGKGCSESVSVLDVVVNNIMKYLVESGLLPHGALYPSNDLNPIGGINIVDLASFGFYRPLADSFGGTDAIGSLGIGKGLSESVSILDLKVKSFGKYISESTLNIDDIQGFGFYSLLVDNIIINDDIRNSVGKNIIDDMTILDIVSSGTISYLEDNLSISDQISKHGNKLITDSLAIEDGIVRNILLSLSEHTTIDDDAEVILRTLVRATLRAIKVDGATLRAL